MVLAALAVPVGILAIEGNGAAEIAVADLRYPNGELFPENLSEMRSPCRFRRGQPAVLDGFKRDWFTRHLRAADGLPLPDYVAGDADITRQVRFIWLPSFHHPVVVRFYQRDGEAWLFAAEELTGAGGYDPGDIGRAVARQLTAEEASELLGFVDGEKLFDQPSELCNLGLDGAQWVIEGLDGESYHFLNHWSPQDGVVQEFGTFSLGLTGWDVGEIY